ncbi:unnamed protein product [Cochlearia groenlandica]
MAIYSSSYILLLCFFALLVSSITSEAKYDEDKKVYIVYMGALPTRVNYMPMSHHNSLLQGVIGDSLIENRMVRSYKRSFNGFAAKLTESEREIIASMDEVVSVFPSKKLKLQTTTSWDFVGLKKGKRAKRNPMVESDTIIGVIDSGIYRESESFKDKGFGPMPKKWRGVCEGGKNFSCNNKLIGARYYTPKVEGLLESADDNMGHGSHTASTAAGNVVKDVSFYGLGNGTARGGVPAARIAVYKVCESGLTGCTTDGILAAFDDAIADNVDLITISIGGDPTLFELDPIAIGAFHAMAKGILTVNSAGNSGPQSSTVGSVAPWIFTTAASNTNRAFITKVVLGNGKTVAGRSVNSFDLKRTKYPLVYGESAASGNCSAIAARACAPGCLDNKLVKGKIVLCDLAQNPEEALYMGAVASISKTSSPDSASIFSFPVSVLSEDDYDTVLSYMNSTKNPKASVLKTETVFDQTAPVVASYSSRGPNPIISDILKPDITAPGSEILAAYSPTVPPSSSDTRHVKYSVLSGTSMSCPHVAGVAAYVKSFHPQWSPSMIQSAIMTTTWSMNKSSSPMAEFGYGAGHVDPNNAIHPGLVYEANKADHIAFLCGLNYTGKKLRLISGDSNGCTKQQTKSLPRNLNYPSMTSRVTPRKSFKITFVRSVTNVGMGNATYKAKAIGNGQLNVKVVPNVLVFKSLYEKKTFTVTVSGKGPPRGRLLSEQLIWSDGFHSVRSPIVVYTEFFY